MAYASAVLCADSESVHFPDALGLDGEDLAAQRWLKVFTSACEARKYLQGVLSERSVPARISQVWVVSSDDVDSINIAAAFKRDWPLLKVCLIAFDCTGSLASRANLAGVDEVLGNADFCARYAEEKKRHHVRAGSGDAGAQDAGGAGGAEDAARTRGAGASGAISIAHIVTGGCEGGIAPSTPFSQDSYPTELLLPVVSSSRPASAPSSAKAPSPQDSKRRSGAGAPSRPALVRSGLDGLPRGGKRAYLLPVLSGSGGAGKSTVAALAAILAAHRGYETLLIDLDLQFGDEETILGAGDALRFDDALDDPAKLACVQADGARPALVAALRRLERAEEAAEALPVLLDVLRTRFDVIIANTGGFWAEQHAVLLERSSKALFLVDQRPSSLRACRRAIDLCGRCGIATGPFLFAVNRCSKGSLYSSIDVSCAMRGSNAVELKDGGREVEDLISAGHPYDLLETGNALTQSLDLVLGDILPVRPHAAGKTAASSGGGNAGRDGAVARKGRARSPFRAGKRKDAPCRG